MAKICPICATSYPDTDAFCTKDGATLRAQESSSDLVGTVIADRYMVNELLGEGGMGRVYLARHVRLPQQAAIKVLHPGMVRDADAVARFNREAANAARIEHDRVARVFDFGETTDGLVYLAMEFVPGRTLRALLAEEGRLSPARAANLIYQVADGLDAAHRIGIIHRDLKPDNILVVTDENGVDRSKVVDFGIAKVVDNSQTQLTQTGMLVGTPEFMSPEQVLGEQLDARSDVYALALVAYQAFTGALPFGGSTPERSLAARLMEDPQPLSATAPDVAWPDALQFAFTRALERDPADRTASALEFGDALVAAVEGWTGAPVLRSRTPMSTPSLNTLAGAVNPASITPPLGAPTLGGGKAAPVGVTASATASTNAAVTTPPRARRTPMMLGGIGIAAAAVLSFALLKGFGGKESATTVVPPVAADASVGGPAVSTPAPVATAPAGTPANTQRDQASRGTVDVPNAGSGSTPSSPASTSGSAATPASSAANDGDAPLPGAANVLRADMSAFIDLGDALLRSSDAERDAQRVIQRGRALLPRVSTPIDSFTVHKSLFEAYMLSGDEVNGCINYRAARRLAQRLPEKRSALAVYEGQVSCI